jgi:hypothetical protein
LIHTVTNEEITKFDPKVAEVMRFGPDTWAGTHAFSSRRPDLNRPALVIGALVLIAAIVGAFFWFYSSPSADVKSKAPEIRLDRPPDNTPLAPNMKVIR